LTHFVGVEVIIQISEKSERFTNTLYFPLSGHAILVFQSGSFSNENSAPEIKATTIGNMVV